MRTVKSGSGLGVEERQLRSICVVRKNTQIAEAPYVLDLLRLFVVQLRCGFVGGNALSGPGIVNVKFVM